MKPVRQQFRHEPDRGIYGDCHRAAIASLFECDIDEVPHFAWDNPDHKTFQMRVDRWLDSLGFAELAIPCRGSLRDVVPNIGKDKPDVHWLLSGTSRSGFGHTVVGCAGRVVHDPGGAGIVSPCDDGFFWVTFLVPKHPKVHAAQRLTPRPGILRRLWRSVTGAFA